MPTTIATTSAKPATVKSGKPARKIITAATIAAAKPATPVPAIVKPAVVNAATPSTVAISAVKAAMQAAEKPDTAKPAGGGYVNRAATKPQNYGADHQSDRDIAYLRFFASFLRGRPTDTTITYAEIVERQRAASMRNPLPGAGGKNGCIDRGILSRFDKFGFTVNVADPNDKSRRIGFRFTAKALDLAPVKAGMRDTYIDGRLSS